MSKLEGVNLSHPPVSLGLLAFRGPDAARFLQGQVSADVGKLSVATSTLAGLHNPQGRVIALLAIVRTAAEEFQAVLPLELAHAVSQRLQKYILRSKLQIDAADSGLRIVGSGAPVAGLASVAWGSRHMLLVPEARLGEFDLSDPAVWQAADIAEGLPQVRLATSESFVAQMLNLDLLGAIAFDKGCYTGQEVIARSHYRGRVKRRLQRWFTRSDAPLQPGDGARGADGRALTIVSAARVAGGQELLAVGPYAVSEDTAAVEDAPRIDSGLRVEGPLPLPYSLPD